jgi:hypothetical protein
VSRLKLSEAVGKIFPVPVEPMRKTSKREVGIRDRHASIVHYLDVIAMPYLYSIPVRNAVYGIVQIDVCESQNFDFFPPKNLTSLPFT